MNKYSYKKLLTKISEQVKQRLGYWYCDKCNKYHPREVIAYDYSNGEHNCICHLGLDDLEEYGCNYRRVKL